MQPLVAALRCYLASGGLAGDGAEACCERSMRGVPRRDITNAGIVRGETLHDPDPSPRAARGDRMLSTLLAASMAAALATPPAPPPVWHDGLDWHGVHVSVSTDPQG